MIWGLFQYTNDKYVHVLFLVPHTQAFSAVLPRVDHGVSTLRGWVVRMLKMTVIFNAWPQVSYPAMTRETPRTLTTGSKTPKHRV